MPIGCPPCRSPEAKGPFASYPADEKLPLVGINSCPGCPTLTGADKLLQRVKGLTEFTADVIHLVFCMKALCPFTKNYTRALTEAFPTMRVVVGTHQESETPEEYRERIEKLFTQRTKSMVDGILQRDDGQPGAAADGSRLPSGSDSDKASRKAEADAGRQAPAARRSVTRQERRRKARCRFR